MNAPIVQELGPIESGSSDSVSTLASWARRNPNLSLAGGHSRRNRCGTVSGWAIPCSPAGLDRDPECVKCPPVPNGSTTHYPWTIVDLEGCQEPWDSEQWQDLADAVVADGTASAITAELQNGNYTGGASLQSEAIDLTSSAGASHPIDGVQTLLAACAITSHGRGVLHVPQQYEPTMVEHGLIRPTAGGYRGANGMPVDVGTGLTGVGPDMSGNVDEAAIGRPYIYISGGVEYNVGPIESYDERGKIADPSTNLAAAEARRRAVLSFESCKIFAVQICTIHESCCAPTEAP